LDTRTVTVSLVAGGRYSAPRVQNAAKFLATASRSAASA